MEQNIIEVKKSPVKVSPMRISKVSMEGEETPKDQGYDFEKMI
jgi:hypothetical protein